WTTDNGLRLLVQSGEQPGCQGSSRAAALGSPAAHVMPNGTTPGLRTKLTVLVRTLDQLDAALAFRPAMVYSDVEDLRRYREAVSRTRDAGVPIGLATLRIVKPGEDGFLRTIAGIEPDAVLIRNLAGLSFFRAHAPHVHRIGDFSLNVA